MVINLVNDTFEHLHGLYTYGRAIGSFRILSGYQPEVVIFEESDEILAEFRDYPTKWTVMRLVSGSVPQLAYAGPDLDEAITAYGETVQHVKAIRNQMWSL